MNVFHELEALRQWRASLTGTVALVPTMGFLHAGHEALLEAAKNHADHVVMSIFVNPKQFNEATDYNLYPRDDGRDLSIAKKYELDAVWQPSNQLMYARGDHWTVMHDDFELMGEGRYRPGHFQGVATVVMKLIQQTGPNYLFLGEKDFQQYQWIKSMVLDFFIPTEVIQIATVRVPSGLALSSRNARLSESDRVKAAMLYQVLSSSICLKTGRSQLEEAGFEVEYLEEVDGRRFVAAWLGGVRLIDTIQKELIA